MSTALKLALLGLLWPHTSASSDRPPDFSDDDWAILDAMARQHRLQPLLHAAGGAWRAPEALRARWQAAHRSAAMASLRQAATLVEIEGVLARHAVRATLLKGGAFLWRGWDGPALRPMRDIDLLVDESDAHRVQAMLREAGLVPAVLPVADHGKHLPPLVSRSGTCIELHLHVLDMGDADQRGREQRFRAARVAGAEPADLPFLKAQAIDATAPTDTLLHIVAHSVLDHQFNNGPLLLYDIALLVRNGAIDWARFWHVAGECDMLRAAQLGLALAQYWSPDLDIEWDAAAPESLADPLLRGASLMMLVDSERRSELGWLGRAIRPSLAKTLVQVRRAFARGQAHDPAAPPRMPARTAAWSKVLRHLAVATRAEDRAHVAYCVRVGAWLQTPMHRNAPGKDRDAE